MRSCGCSAGFAGLVSPGPWAAPLPAAGATAKLVSLCAVSSRQHDTWLPSAPSIDHDRSVASCEPDTTSGDEPACPADGLPGTNPQQVTDCVCPLRSKSSLLCRRSHTLSSQPWPSKPLEQLTKSCPSAETAQHVKTLLCAPSKTPAGCDRSRVSHTRSRKSSDACHTHQAARQRGAGGARAAPAGLAQRSAEAPSATHSDNLQHKGLGRHRRGKRHHITMDLVLRNLLLSLHVPQPDSPVA